MTERERKDYYLKRIRKKLITQRFLSLIKEDLEEELRIIIWNNPKEWAKEFINEEVIPYLRKFGITLEMRF